MRKKENSAQVGTGWKGGQETLTWLHRCFSRGCCAAVTFEWWTGWARGQSGHLESKWGGQQGSQASRGL